MAKVTMFCQTFIEPGSDVKNLTRDKIYCKLTYTAQGKIFRPLLTQLLSCPQYRVDFGCFVVIDFWSLDEECVMPKFHIFAHLWYFTFLLQNGRAT